MKFKMAPNSLFAVLLRSPWWISFAVVGIIVLIAGALLPAEYFVVGSLAGFPIFVVGCLAAWRQLRAPSPARVVEMKEAIHSMAWKAFCELLSTHWRQQGYEVTTAQGVPSGSADLALTQAGRVTLVSARRWKAATHGVEPLRDLHAALQSQGASTGIYVIGDGSLSDNARIFARDHGITVLQGDALAAWLLTRH